MDNRAIIITKDGEKKEFTLPNFGELTVHIQNGKILYVNTNIKEKV